MQLRTRIGLYTLVSVAVAAVLLVIANTNYLLFHVIAEFISIAIGVAAFIIAWTSRRYLQNGYLLFLGYSAVYVAFIDMLHTIAYRGMGVFPGMSADPATQLWLAGRYLQAAALLLAPLFLRIGPRSILPLAGFSAVTTLLVASIFYWDIFPTAFIDGQGLTAFKIGSEYVIIAAYLMGLALLYNNRQHFDRLVLWLLAGNILASVLSEFIFTGYVVVDGTINMLGHLLKIIAFFLLYKAIIETGIEQPYRLIFRELKTSEAALIQSEASLEEQVVARTRELDEQRTLLETVLREAASGILVIDAVGEITFANAAARDFIRRAEDASGEENFDWGTIITPDGQQLSPRQWLLLHTLKDEPLFEQELRLVHPDGSISDLIGSISPLHRRDGSLSGSVIILTDITGRREAEEALRQLNVELEERVEHRTAELAHELDERKRVEAALRLSQARLRRLAESNIVGIATIHDQGAILAANEAVLDLIGYTVEDLKNQVIRWDTITPPQYHAQDARAFQEARETGVCTPYEKELLHKDGHHVPIYTGFAALEGAPGEYIAYIVDTSAQKRAEAAMQRYAEQLERSNRELQEFAYVASHDLQEPLRKIIAFGDRLERSASQKLDGVEQDYVRRMQRAATRMRGMIDGLLNLSRVTTKAQPFVPVNLNRVMSDILLDLEVRIESSKAEVQVGPLPTVRADPVQMRQLLLNLTANAIKFSRPGVPPVVKISGSTTRQDGHRKVELHVSDNGIGIDERFSERIFQPFQRLHGMGEYEGSGMGLAIVHKIIERHGGSIQLSSKPGEGSTFIIILPQTLEEPKVEINEEPVE